MVQLLAEVMCDALPEQHQVTFPSRTICGGRIYRRFSGEHSGRYRRAGHLRRLMRTTLNKLGGARTIIEEIIHYYSASGRVNFTYTGIICERQFFETNFDLSDGRNVNSGITDLQGFILHDYQEILKALSVLQFIRSEENEIQSRNRLCLTENLLYEALCSMNIALRTLGVRGEEVSRGIEIERTTDMCDAFNLSRRYVRDLELFRLLERVFNQMYTRFSMWLYS